MEQQEFTYIFAIETHNNGIFYIMVKITDSKTIRGRIIKMSRSRCYCSIWGNILFHGKEIMVSVKNKKIPMYIRDDSTLGILQLLPQSLENRMWEINLHGEYLESDKGIIVIDKILPLSLYPKLLNLNDYF